MTRRLTRRVLGSDEWGIMLVNCLQKALAMSLLRVSVRWPKVMGWFGGVVVVLLESDLRRRKYCDVLYLCEHDSTVFIHVSLLVIRISCVSCSLSVLMSGSVGDCVRRVSRWRMRDLAVSERLGMQLGMWPRGMCFREAAARISRNTFSPVLQEEGSPSKLKKASSVSRVKASQLAFLKFVNVW